eukprot:1131986_1
MIVFVRLKRVCDLSWCVQMNGYLPNIFTVEWAQSWKRSSPPIGMMDKCKNDGKLYALQQLQNKNIPDAFVDIARNSKFWNMSYDDLIPAEFATELFDDQNKELLPPNVLSKIKEDAHYWTRVMEESNQILLPHQSEQEVKKFIEDSDDNLAQDEIEYVERQPLTKRRRLNRRRNSRKLARTVDMS